MRSDPDPSESARLAGRMSARSQPLNPPQPVTVSTLVRSIRDLLEHRYPLQWVRGEISNFIEAKSGHVYFVLKDAQAQVRCVMFRQRAQLLDWRPRDGMQVEIRALVTLYEPRGDFQLNVDSMRRAGVGALFEAFLRLRDQLDREGLFDAALKRALPAFPRCIGVVTSLHAAALRDVLTTLERRNPSIPVIVYPTGVQGAAAAAEIVAAIKRAGRRAEVDVLIVARGGGSIEDLWCFNDEAVARAIRGSPIPIVSGVGHETDFTIADFVADVRAPTPTAAAELVSPPREALLDRIDALIDVLSAEMHRLLETHAQTLDFLRRRLLHPAERVAGQRALLEQLQRRLARATTRSIDERLWLLGDLRQRMARRMPAVAPLRARVDGLQARLGDSLRGELRRLHSRTEGLERALSHLDPRQVLARGYGIVRDEAGHVITDAARVAAGDRIDVTLAIGSLGARVESSKS